MHFTAFENAYLLQSAGWAILNSFWQAAFLWLIYIFITALFNKNTSAVFKYNFSLLLLFTSFIWFIFTIIRTYFSLKNTSPEIALQIDSVKILTFSKFDYLLPLLSYSYAALFIFYIIRFINNYKKITSLQKKTLIKAPLDLRMFTKNISLHIGIKNKVQVWLSDQIDVPSVIGFIKPVILFPAAIINHLTTGQLEAILLHELAHIKRNDYFVNLLQSLIEVVLFFNPFAILLSNYAKKERENCCDDWVLNFQYDKQQYAGALLILEEQRHQHLQLAMAATNKKEILLNRVKRIFYVIPQTSISSLQKIQMVTVSVLLLAAIAFSFPRINERNTLDTRVAFNRKTTISNSIQPLPVSRENADKEIFASGFDEPTKYPNINKRKISKKQIINVSNNEHPVAFINEELLNGNNQLNTIAANEKEITDTSYYVKIEEQESGEQKTNVYYFQLKKDKSNTSIKPLMMISEPISKHKNEVKKAFGSTTSTPSKIITL